MADRYLLESSPVDGYLLEDGSGVYLLDSAVTISEADGNASGIGASAIVGAALWLTLIASTGAAAIDGVSGATAGSPYASAGVAADNVVGTALFTGQGASVGLATVDGIGAAPFVGVSASTGVASDSVIGASTFAGLGSSIGSASDSIISGATTGAPGASAGAAIGSATGEDAAAVGIRELIFLSVRSLKINITMTNDLIISDSTRDLRVDAPTRQLVINR